MADELVEHCSKLHIDNGEEDVFDLDNGFEDAQEDKLVLRLVGRILTKRQSNFDAMKRTLTYVWNLKDGVIIRSMGVNLFLFQFFPLERL
ncbi:unnamed protein product [Amaranthus hypochondriacus]